MEIFRPYMLESSIDESSVKGQNTRSFRNEDLLVKNEYQDSDGDELIHLVV